MRLEYPYVISCDALPTLKELLFHISLFLLKQHEYERNIGWKLQLFALKRPILHSRPTTQTCYFQRDHSYDQLDRWYFLFVEGLHPSWMQEQPFFQFSCVAFEFFITHGPQGEIYYELFQE